MEKMVLAGIFALAASTALAQTSPATDPAGAAGPANLCQELLGFMEARPPEEAETTPASAKAGEPAEEGVAVESDKTAAAEGEETASVSGQAVKAQSGAESSSAQELTGQGGPATESPDGTPAPSEESTAQNAPQRNSMSAPVTNDPTSTPKDSILSVAEARDLADGGDIAACQSAARELRIAGVAVPAPLLALTALDLQYQSAATGPQRQAPGAEDAPAPPTQGD